MFACGVEADMKCRSPPPQAGVRFGTYSVAREACRRSRPLRLLKRTGASLLQRRGTVKGASRPAVSKGCRRANVSASLLTA